MREWLKSYRLSKKLTQEELSVLTGISRGHYAQIENAKKRPSPEVAKVIAKELDFDWTLFFQDKRHSA